MEAKWHDGMILAGVFFPWPRSNCRAAELIETEDLVNPQNFSLDILCMIFVALSVLSVVLLL